DRILLAPNVPGWGSLALERRLRDGLGVAAVAVCNDVRAAATAELRAGVLRGCDVALYLSLGTGLSMGLVVGGRVVDGAHGAAGEIGYTLGRPGEPGVAAGRAPLEERVSGPAIGQRACRPPVCSPPRLRLLSASSSPRRSTSWPCTSPTWPSPSIHRSSSSVAG